MDCNVDLYEDIVDCSVFGLKCRGGIWVLGYLVSCFVFFACKCYCSILLLQTLFYLFFPPPQHTTMAPCNGTQQWHHVRSPKVGRRPPIAHYNGTLQWHPAMAPRPLPQSWSSPSPSTIVRYNDTLRWHPAMAPSSGTTSTAPCNGTLVPRPIRQSGSSPPPYRK